MAALQGSTCWAHPNAHVQRWEELEPRLPKSTSGSSKPEGSQQLPCSMPRETPEQCQLWLLMTLCLGTQKENLTFFFSIGEVTIHIQLFPCTWVSLELVIQDTEKEKSLLLPTLKVSLLAHANKGGRVFSFPPPEGGLGLRTILLPFTQQLMLQPATCTSSSSPALQCQAQSQVLMGARFGARLSCPARS